MVTMTFSEVNMGINYFIFKMHDVKYTLTYKATVLLVQPNFLNYFESILHMGNCNLLSHSIKVNMVSSQQRQENNPQQDREGEHKKTQTLPISCHPDSTRQCGYISHSTMLF